MTRSVLLALLSSAIPLAVTAQQPFDHYAEAVALRYSAGQPVVSYTLRIDSTDLRSWSVAMTLRNLPDTFHLAMAAHPEYDDRFYRQVTDIAVTSSEGTGSVARSDSAVWRVVAPGGAALVRYRITLPAPATPPRGAWRPFLTPTGGLTGGPHAFMYVLGGELAPAHVRLDLPRSWDVATGLEPTADPLVFHAPTVHVLVESPLLVGLFSEWHFMVDAVPHRVVYWRSPTGTPFDTVGFVEGIERLTREAVALFGRPPYREFTFLFQDDAYGGLEHPNSVTLGAESRLLARDPLATLDETSHEFFHTWNLMRIRPEEYRDVSHQTQPPTAGLWFSEGLTMYYADLLLRRTGLPVPGTDRIEHLQALITRYLASPGNYRFSAESLSRVEYNVGPIALGDYTASTHLVGELLGGMLDLEVRRATAGGRSMDDVMRLMLARSGGPRGFNGKDVEDVVEEVCGCEVSPFFAQHVRGGGSPIDFDRYLAAIGMRVEVKWEPALVNGLPEPDLRIWAWEPEGETGLRLIVGHPETSWTRAGLHSGDRVISIDGRPVRTWPEFRGALRQSRIGDTLAFEIRGERGPLTRLVTVSGYQRPAVSLIQLAEATPAQIELRRRWLSAR